MKIALSFSWLHCFCIAFQFHLAISSPLVQLEDFKPQPVDGGKPIPVIIDVEGDNTLQLHLTYWPDSPTNAPAIVDLFSRVSRVVQKKLDTGGDLTVPVQPQVISLMEGYYMSFARDAHAQDMDFQYRRLSGTLHALLTYMRDNRRFQHIEAKVFSIDPFAHPDPFGFVKVVDGIIPDDALDVTNFAEGLDSDPGAVLLTQATENGTTTIVPATSGNVPGNDAVAAVETF